MTAMCNCSTGIETANPFLRCKILTTINHIVPKTCNFVDDDLVIQMFCLSDNLDHSIKNIVEATVRYTDEN